MSINPQDLQINAWPPAPKGGMQTGRLSPGVEVIHKPSGIKAAFAGFRSQHHNKEECLRQIEEELAECAKREREDRTLFDLTLST